MKSNKNKFTDEQKQIIEFIEKYVKPVHRTEAALFMGYITFISDICKNHVSNSCYNCPFFDDTENIMNLVY